MEDCILPSIWTFWVYNYAFYSHECACGFSPYDIFWDFLDIFLIVYILMACWYFQRLMRSIMSMSPSSTRMKRIRALCYGLAEMNVYRYKKVANISGLVDTTIYAWCPMFLGFANFYHELFRNYLKIVFTLTQLMQKNQLFILNWNIIEAFEA